MLYTFTPNKLYGRLLNVQPNLVFLKVFNTEFDDITVTFTNQNGRPLRSGIYSFRKKRGNVEGINATIIKM